MRLIDADALNLEYEVDMADDWKTAHEIANIVKYAPTIDAEPVRHGKWIDEGQADDFFPHHTWRCSECGEQVLEIGVPWYKHCPECGARMDKDD